MSYSGAKGPLTPDNRLPQTALCGAAHPQRPSLNETMNAENEAIDGAIREIDPGGVQNRDGSSRIVRILPAHGGWRDSQPSPIALRNIHESSRRAHQRVCHGPARAAPPLH